MNNIALDEKIVDVKLSVSASNDQKDDASAIKPAETSNQLPKKGVINKAMDYGEAMTSPTELLAPEAFPDEITDMNGNAMRDDHKAKISIREGTSTVRCLLWFMIFFILTTIALAALFTWKMVQSDVSEATVKEVCYTRTKPVPFETIPKKITEYLKSWREDIKADVAKNNESVAVVNVVYYDKVIWEAKYRWDSKKKTAKIGKVKLFPVASITKVITALLAFKMYNDGEIGLDDPIVKYEPNFWVRNPFNNDNGSGITLRELITYSSGLPREAPCHKETPKSYCPYDTNHMLQQLRKNTSRLLFPPGKDALYGNLPFAIAGNVMGKNYSGGYAKLVQDKIFEPLHMKSSTFTMNNTKNIFPPLPTAKSKNSLKNWGWLNPAGGLFTTVHDLAQLEIGLFNNNHNQYLRSAILDEFFTPDYFFTDGKQMLGSSWSIGFHKGYLNYTKDGFVYGGYCSMIKLLPELRLAVNLVSTSHNCQIYSTLPPKMDILFDLFHDELAKLPQNMQQTPVSNPKRFIGVYDTNEVQTLHNVAMKISTYKKENDTHHYLRFSIGDMYTFPLTYLGDYIFGIMQVNRCKDFSLGINGERIYFTKPKNTRDKVNEFVIYGIHLKGKVTFHRKHT
ncbi:beta-lactamase-like protein 4 isoform X2 [Dendronephthya gigantea]|uniref:beta-lactamase-like protein 4 isoform X2 n=1 Tax=Dendronephthya gigantea TaxID=151771 RepID=UPI001068EFF2|nr:beta-lactamase-like protein 4 isoform X2 [Dendronephthya gigantea]